MSSTQRAPDTESILTLLRILLEPRTSADERRRAADSLARCQPESLAAYLAQPRVASALRSMDVSFTVPGEDRRIPFGPGSYGQYGLGADLRLLINDAFNECMWAIPVAVEGAFAASERARLIGAAREHHSDDGDDVVRGLAWTQLDPGAPLLRWRSAQRTQITAYLQHALYRGGAGVCIPLPFARAVNRGLACREVERQWFDSTYAWIEAWTACTPLVTIECQDVQFTIRRMHRMLRVGLALRAASADMRMPRLLALAELAGAITVIRAAGMADLIRAYHAADGDPCATALIHQKSDRNADLLVEVAIGEVLRPLSVSELEALHESERVALRFATDLLSADPRLQAGLLSSPEPLHLTEAEPSDGTP